MIADIAVFVEFEANSGLAADRVGIQADSNIADNLVVFGHAGELLLVVLAAEHATAIGGGIDDTRIVDTRILCDEDTFLCLVLNRLGFVEENLLLQFHDRNFAHHLSLGNPVGVGDVLRSVDTTFGADDDIACHHFDH